MADLVTGSRVLEELLDMSYEEVISARKRTVKDMSFGILGYSVVSGTSGRASGRSFYQTTTRRRVQSVKKPPVDAIVQGGKYIAAGSFLLENGRINSDLSQLQSRSAVTSRENG